MEYVSLLRGINVSGQKQIKMEALAKMYESLKFTEVKTYIQSGNVMFSSPIKDAAQLEKKISEKIRTTFGFDVIVIIRSKEELRKIVRQNKYAKKDPKQLYITFLAQEPTKEILRSFLLPDGTDECAVDGKQVYLYCPGGYGKTKLSNAFLEKKFKVAGTTRNWNTCLYLSK